MANVQSYKSQCNLHGAVMPMQNGGGDFSWDSAWQVPDVAGNFSDQNYVAGMQMPTFDINYVLLDGSASQCPIHNTILSDFLTRTGDAYSDVTPFTNPYYFNGADGWQAPYAKPGQFTIGGSKGELVRFSASYASYVPVGSSAPTFLTANPAAYNAFTGTPISFQHCSFYTGAGYNTPLNGVVSWNLTFSNNLTPDMSMVSGGSGQQVFPIDVNAGKPTASLQLTFTADENNLGDQVTVGSSFAVHIATGSVSVTIICPSVIYANNRSRSNNNPRVMRNYSGRCLGIGNAQNQYPVVITA